MGFSWDLAAFSSDFSIPVDVLEVEVCFFSGKVFLFSSLFLLQNDWIVVSPPL